MHFFQAFVLITLAKVLFALKNVPFNICVLGSTSTPIFLLQIRGTIVLYILLLPN